MIKKFLLSLLFLLPFLTSKVMVPQEFMQYKVGYMFLRVGTIYFYNEGLVERNGEIGYKLKLWVESNPDIKFVTIQDYYEAIVTEDFRTLYFYGRQRTPDGNYYEAVKEFKYEENQVASKVIVIKYSLDKENHKVNSLQITNLYANRVSFETLPLFYYARHLAAVPAKDIELLVSVGTSLDLCKFFTSGTKQTIEFENKKEKTWYMDGKVQFLGIAGIRDGFKGWFSTNPQQYPLVAHLKAFFGNIVLSLEDVRIVSDPTGDEKLGPLKKKIENLF